MHESRHLEPYLGPRALLSQSWLSQPLLSLILAFVSLAFISSSIKPVTRDAQQTLEASCDGVEQAANVIVSLPHFMADGLNEINSKAVEHAMSGAARVIDLVLVAITQIVLFAIDVYKSLFLCLMDLAVHGSLTLLIQAAQEIDEFVTRAFQGVRSGLQDAVQGINSGLESTLGLIDRIPGVDFEIPQIDVPNLSALENVQLPHSIIDGLESLNNSIPTLDELKTSIDAFVSTPVNELRASINETLRNATLDIETLPVPARHTVDICTRLDTTWLDTIAHDVSKVVRISMALVALAAVVLILSTTFLAHRRNKTFLSTLSLVKSSWLSSLSPLSPPSETLSTVRLVTHHSALSHPFVTSLIHSLYPPSMQDSHKRTRKRSRTTWFLTYVSNSTGLALLAFGIVGLVVVSIQIAVLRGPVADMARRRAEEGARDFRTSLTETINDDMLESVKSWETGMNERIVALETKVNEDLFDWINKGTSTVNSTINAFYDGVTDAIGNVFNGTVLQDPITGLCLIGSKVAALSTALTWLHENLHLTLPRASSSLLLSPDRASELVNNNSDSSSNNPASPLNLVDKILRAWIRNLEQARLGFSLAIALWGLLVLFGLIGVLWDVLKDKSAVESDEKEKRTSTTLKTLHLASGEKTEDASTSYPIRHETSGSKLSAVLKKATTAVRDFQPRFRTRHRDSTFSRISSPQPTYPPTLSYNPFEPDTSPIRSPTRSHLPISITNTSFASSKRLISNPEYLSSTCLPHLDMSQPSVPYPFPMLSAAAPEGSGTSVVHLNPFATPFDAIDEEDELSDDEDYDNDDELKRRTRSKAGTGRWELETIAVAK
ncbi:hypothetical protein ACM66B_003216 [Microbotryomycetes sp. NB124-2]